MKKNEIDLLWLYFAMAYEAAARGSFDDAHSHSLKALDMILECSARRKQLLMAAETIVQRRTA